MHYAQVVKVYTKSVWIESDILGARHVMVQHNAPGEEPFCYATFHYNHRHTSNSGTMNAATRVAIALGATEPVEQRQRSIAV